jgi:hypothetical protein
VQSAQIPQHELPAARPLHFHHHLTRVPALKPPARPTPAPLALPLRARRPRGALGESRTVHLQPPEERSAARRASATNSV